jgi:putative salt-induced outer membrane protein YdiY
MKKTYTIIITALFGLAMTAQAEWESAIHAGAGLTTGNSETSSYAAGIESKNTNDVTQIHLSLKGAYGEAEINGVEDTTTESAKGEAIYRNVVSDPMYVYVNGSLLYDAIANINYRGIVGPGVGTFLINKDVAQMGLEVGAAFIFEELENTISSQDADGNAVSSVVDVADENIALRVGQFYNRDLSETSRFWQTLEYLPLFEDFGDYLLNAEVGIESDISGSLSLRVVATEQYDATPAAGADESDFTITAGLSYKL